MHSKHLEFFSEYGNKYCFSPPPSSGEESSGEGKGGGAADPEAFAFRKRDRDTLEEGAITGAPEAVRSVLMRARTTAPLEEQRGGVARPKCWNAPAREKPLGTCTQSRGDGDFSRKAGAQSKRL